MSIEELNKEEIEALNSIGLRLKNIADIYDVNFYQLYTYVVNNNVSVGRKNLGPRYPLFYERIGRLTVTNMFKREGKKGHRIVYKCLCDCGNETWVSMQALKEQRTKSCGCLVSETSRIPFGEATKNAVISEYKLGARGRDYSWELTDEQALGIMAQNCYYCGIPPSTINRSKFNNGDFIYNGIDRKDNTKGYILDNCVPCCTTCNRAKRDMTEKDWFEWIDNLVRYQMYLKEKL